MEEKQIVGPDELDMGASNFHRKFRWVVKLFNDGKQVHKAEFLKRCQRPPLTIYATVLTESGLPESGNCGGEMFMTFLREDIEFFDEIWLGLYDGAGQIVEEWEIMKTKRMPLQLFTDHTGMGYYPYDEDDEKQTVRFQFGNMMNRNHTEFELDPETNRPKRKTEPKWENWSNV